MTTTDARKAAAAREAALNEQWIRDFADLVITGASDRLDLGNLVSTGLALAAAELGGVDELAAGRRGSWQNESLLRLANGKLGPTSPLATVHPIGRAGRRACPFYREEHVAGSGVTLAEHVARCPDWHQGGAEESRPRD